jgi:hypothetical protein
LWGAGLPYGLGASVNIIETETTNLVDKIDVNFSFNEEKDFEKYFRQFNTAFKMSGTSALTEFLGLREFAYNDISGNIISITECLDLKTGCLFNTSVNLTAEIETINDFKIDSINDLNAGVAFGIRDPITSEIEDLNCVLWEEDETNGWLSKNIPCGVTGGDDPDKGYPTVNIVASNVDANSVELSGECQFFDSSLDSQVDTDGVLVNQCGLVKNNSGSNSYVQLGVNKSQTKLLITSKIDTKLLKANDANLKDDSIVNTSLIVKGREKDFKDPADEVFVPNATDTFSFNERMFNPEYRTTLADNAVKSGTFTASGVRVDSDAEFKSLSSTSTTSLVSSNVAKIDENLNSKRIVVTSLSELGTETNSDVVLDNSLTTSKSLANNDVTVYNKVEINNLDTERAFFVGDLTVPKLNITNSSTSWTTRGLDFGDQMTTNNMRMSRSLVTDGLPYNYSTLNGAIANWHSPSYSSLQNGIYTKKLKIYDNDLIISGSSASTVSSTGNYYIIGGESYGLKSGFGINYQRKTGRRYLQADEFGRVTVSPWWNFSGTNEDGFKVGANSNFYFGRSLTSPLPLERGIYSNLASSIYGYDANELIPRDDYNGYKIIARNLTVNTAWGIWYNGGKFHQGRVLDGNGNTKTETIDTVQCSGSGYCDYWETNDNYFLRHTTWSINWWYTRSNAVYSRFLDLTRKNTITGVDGDKGNRGQIGAQGLKGDLGELGIPGIVGRRGGS